MSAWILEEDLIDIWSFFGRMSDFGAKLTPVMKIKWHKLAIWNKQVIGRIFGGQIAGVALALAVIVNPTHAFEYSEITVANREVVVTTLGQYTLPVAQLTGISQGYHLLHNGVDLRAPKGTSVLAMSGGVVIEVKRMGVGYGHFVRIAHEGILSTLYAHLDKVWVEPGQKVERGQDIGTIGLTGWTTGPHLHFEIYEGNKAVNPTRYIGSDITPLNH